MSVASVVMSAEPSGRLYFISLILEGREVVGTVVGCRVVGMAASSPQRRVARVGSTTSVCRWALREPVRWWRSAQGRRDVRNGPPFPVRSGYAGHRTGDVPMLMGRPRSESDVHHEMWAAPTMGGFGGVKERVVREVASLTRDVIDPSGRGVRDVVRYLCCWLALVCTVGSRGTDEVRRTVVTRVRGRRGRTGPVPRAAPLRRCRTPDAISDGRDQAPATVGTRRTTVARTPRDVVDCDAANRAAARGTIAARPQCSATFGFWAESLG